METFILSKDKYLWRLGKSPPELDQHSKTKHDVLRSYLEQYVETLTVNPRREKLTLTLVDGFSGGGNYLDKLTGKVCFGSPLIMLEAMKIAEARVKEGRIKKNFVLDV
ncbi:MAG: hypothetical protein JWM11_8049, partial [Planctomycetaceae bacterium]|nr:hypothetical protein [Planctomycetaceae bacterium]